MGSNANRQDGRPDARTPPGGANWQREQFSTLAEMNDFLARLTARLTALGFSEKEVFGVRLGVEEAVVNAIRHGHKSDPSKQVQVTYSIDAQQVVVEVKDQGPGFDPDKVPSPLAPENLERPGGRGVFLMNAYMTWIHFNDQGNCVTLCKTRSA
jgi:serine/threonine-protein kinase RsbW